tara:strand:- start:46971 stop:47207 length:237 start_codon:yes stop_codon:yes gene_type:complete
MIEESNIIEEVEQRLINKINAYVLGEDPSYLDAVILACEELEIEPELAAKMLPAPIKEKLEQEASHLNMIPKKSKLPI